MNENFVINSLGYTGIGTIDPTATLHIEPIYPSSGLFINTEYSNGGIVIQNTANTSAKLVLNQVGSNNGQAYYLVSRNDGQFVIGNANNGIVDMKILWSPEDMYLSANTKVQPGKKIARNPVNPPFLKVDKLISFLNSLKQYSAIKAVTKVILWVTMRTSFTPSSIKLLFSRPWNPNSEPIKIMFLSPE